MTLDEFVERYLDDIELWRSDIRRLAALQTWIVDHCKLS